MRRFPLVQDNGQIEQLPAADFAHIGKLNLEPRQIIIVNSATINVTSSFVRVRFNGGGTQNVDQINGGERGDILIIHRANGGNNIRFRKGVGNINGGNDRTMRSRDDTLMLIKITGGQWNEVSWQG